MAHLCHILNPIEVRKKSVTLLLNHNFAEHEIPSSPESNFSDNTTMSYPPHEEAPEPTIIHQPIINQPVIHQPNPSHQPHPNCPDSLDCLPDTDGRPQHTLPVILRCAILGSPRKRLTIREIYAAMEDKYRYYRTAGTTWKQSVRHHLSLNRLFERKTRPATEPGFGSYWTVNLSAPPGTKRPRKRGRGNKAATKVEAGTADAGTSSATTSTAVEASTSTSRRGRPRKEVSLPPVKCEDDGEDEDEDELMGDDETQTPLDEEMYDETPDEDLMSRGFMFPSLGLTNFHNVPSSRSPSHPLGESSNSTTESKSADLRRQASDAVQISIRLSDQLAQAKAEVTRAKSELRSVEVLLERETTKRVEAEKMADDEMRLRREAEDALSALKATITATS